MKKDVIALFNDFHNGNVDISRMNYGILTLLPKIKDDLSVSSTVYTS